LASRGVYLSVATLLRANHTPIRAEYKHSQISLGLRADVIESDILVNANLGYLVGMSAMYSHPQADIEKGSAQLNKMYYEAIRAIPYLMGGKSADDAAQAGRQDAIERYKKFREKTQPKLELSNDAD